VSGAVAEQFCYLTTTGRVSGSPHTIEIWFALQGETAYLLSGDRDRSDWVRNLMVMPDVVLKIGERRHAARARVLDEGRPGDVEARRLLLEKYQHAGGEDLAGWGRTALAVAIGPIQP